MAFEVITTPEAELDASDILDWLIEQHAGDTGMRWFLGLDAAIQSLRVMPNRCKLAPEDVALPFEVRELLYGKMPHIYRILFTVEADIVYVLRIRHGRRLPLTSH